VVRVVIADDSASIRLALAAGFRQIPGVEVVGTAADGVEVVGKVLSLRPDLVTLDLDMPNRDGVSAAVAIHRHSPDTLMVLVTGANSETVKNALSYAPHLPIEYLSKPGAGESFEAWIANSLAPLIERLSDRQAQKKAISLPSTTPPSLTRKVEAILVGASTGGPPAVTTLLAHLDPSLGVPVLIVQHMPPKFTEVFARSLDTATPWTVREAYDRAMVRPGEAWVAQGDWHMKVERANGGLQLRLDDSPREHGCRPAVDVLFRSAALSLKGQCIAVMLTGMGRDGTPGAYDLHAQGACFVAQDQATSVVWGMPGALAQSGIPEAVLPLAEIAGWVNMKIRKINSPVRRNSA